MKTRNLLWFVLVIVAFIVGFSQTPNCKLQRDYPVFLEIEDAEFIDKKINQIRGTDSLSDPDTEKLWKLLWAKKDNFRNQYLSMRQRRDLIEKIANYTPPDFYHAYLKFNLLKYKLGVNNLTQLSGISESDVCRPGDLHLQEAQNDNLFEMSAYFDILHFCGIDYTKKDVENLNTAIKKSGDEVTRKHAMEHGVNDVPVFVNNCSKAKGLNEKYHCLFFYSE